MIPPKQEKRRFGGRLMEFGVDVRLAYLLVTRERTEVLPMVTSLRLEV